jgi:2-polyprenyl-3-methyl-5-hydroxy-6-metoxy-1,4-benzoquinol methylase
MQRMPAGINPTYTRDDHVFREQDPYARAKYDLTLRWLPRRGLYGATLYNIGFGSGYFNHLAAARGATVVGCEPDRAAFAAGVATAPPGCELYNCELEEFSTARAPAPFVVMHDVLEHIFDDRAAATTLRSLVAPGGTSIVSVPALMSLFGHHDEELGHYRRYTPKTLRAVLEPHFIIRRLQWFGMASIPIAWYFSRWRRTPYPIAGRSSLAGSIYGAVCAIESHLPEPIGTSLIAELSPRG